MKKYIRFICAFYIITISSIVIASSGYFEPCGRHPFSTFYNHITNKIYMGCVKYEGTPRFVIIDPITLNIDNSFMITGLIKNVIPINNGDSLLLLLADVDSNGTTEDGVLRQIAYSDGHTENEFAFTTIPLGLTVDSQEQYAYVSSGLSHYTVDPIITKINLSTWQREGNDIKYGRWSNYIALTHDDSKLYVKNERVVRIDKNNNWKSYYEVGVFNTSDMSALNPIEIEVQPAVIKMGYDNRLYVSSVYLRGVETPILVIDTNTDTVTPIHYDDISFWDICVDETNHKLYCQALIEFIDPGCPHFPVHKESNLVYQIDLENQYSHQVFPLADENIVLVEAVPINDPDYSCRIFATADNGKKVYYLDVE